MPVLQLNVPITTETPVLLVENKLPIGAHVFRLVVIDDDGLQSAPFMTVVDIVEGPVIGPVGPVGPLSPIPVNPIGPIVHPIAPFEPLDPTNPITRLPGENP